MPKLPESIRIEPATIEHAEDYWTALGLVSREKKYLLFIEPPEIISTLEFVQRILEKGDIQYYAMDDTTVVGWCDILRTHREGLMHVGHLGMGVIAPYRNKGIGSALMRACLDDAQKIGIQRVELEVFSSNANAIILYEKMGFVHEGRKLRARRLHGVYDDILVMAKWIGSNTL